MINYWEEFQAGPARPAGERIYVSINNRREILMNHTAHEKLGEPEAAMLLYDRRYSTIGVKPVRADAPNAFPLHQKKGSRHRVIQAASFCRHFGIEVEGTVAFHGVDRSSDGVLRLDLRTATKVSRNASKG